MSGQCSVPLAHGPFRIVAQRTCPVSDYYASVFFFDAVNRFKTSLLGDEEMLERLAGYLNKDMFVSARMTATGVPPYVTLFMAVEGLPAKLKDMLLTVLREQGIIRPAAGEEQGLIRLLLAKLEKLEVSIASVQGGAGVGGQQQSGRRTYEPVTINVSGGQIYSVIPAGYVIPTRAFDCWTAWCAPHMFGAVPVPALRSTLVDKRAFSDKRRLSDMRTVVKFVTSRLTENLKLEVEAANVTVDAAGAVFRRAKELGLFGACSKLNAALSTGSLSAAVQAIQRSKRASA